MKSSLEKQRIKQEKKMLRESRVFREQRSDFDLALCLSYLAVLFAALNLILIIYNYLSS